VRLSALAWGARIICYLLFPFYALVFLAFVLG
jgi:hypothetical protein